MDTPSQRQSRMTHVDPLTSDTKAFPHGSSSEVRKGLETPPDLKLEKERIASLTVSMERRGVAAPHGGSGSVMSRHGNVRSDDVMLPDASQQHEDQQKLSSLIRPSLGSSSHTSVARHRRRCLRSTSPSAARRRQLVLDANAA